MEITNNLSEKALYDYKIVRNAIAGDEKAYGELFKRYKDSVYFMILKMVNNRTDAEDLMFEAFEKAFASLNYYSPQFAFSTWLFKIASNNTIDFIRKRKAQTVSLDVDDINPEDRGYINSIPADVRTPDEEAIRQQRADFMREKVALLKGRYRRLIELRYFDEFSYEEIADTLAIPLGTVKAQFVCAQRVVVSDSVVFSGVVFDTQDSQTLPNVTCRYGEGKATISDQMGCFVLKIGRKDTVRFTFVGYKPCTVVMPDTLLEDRYMMGVFLSPDTLQLSEALILRRWGEVQRQNLINARNNMTGILKQAYAPVDYMDADMNQRMMLNEYARSVEMKGHVDVGIGVGTQSVDAYKMLRMRRRVKNQKEWLNPNEIDLLKKIYYLKKKEKQDN